MQMKCDQMKNETPTTRKRNMNEWMNQCSVGFSGLCVKDRLTWLGNSAKAIRS